MMNDPEQAPHIADRVRARQLQGDKVSWKPGLGEWSLLHELLAQIRDTIAQANSEKKITPFPRPESEVEKEIERGRASQSEESTKDLVAALTPWAAA